MFTKNLKSKWHKIAAGLCVSGLVLAGLIAAAPTHVAYAAPATPPAQAQTEQTRNARLEKVYQREQQWLNTQQDNLNKMNHIADRVQQFITTQQGKGKDIIALQAALTTFKSQIATAQASHATAAGVLGAHVGFDASGQVTNAAQARLTLLDARQSLRDAHDVMRQAVSDLHRALRTWRQANGLKGAAATPTPAGNG